MADHVTITMDTTALFAALDRLGPAADKVVFEVARSTANAVANEARARLLRQLGPHATGRTVAGIQAREDAKGIGYVVTADNARVPGLPHWLEHGTEHMHARPFFEASVRLETGRYRQRLAEAIQHAIDEQGLGDQ